MEQSSNEKSNEQSTEQFIDQVGQYKDLILSIDIGIVNLGYCIMDKQMIIYGRGNINLLEGRTAKQTQLENNYLICENLHKQLDLKLEQYKPQYFLIEQQIGKYSAVQIQFLLVQYLYTKQIKQSQILIINPRMKLHAKIDGYNVEERSLNKDIAKYHQNKNQSVDMVKFWLQQKKLNQYDLTRDQSDAILQCIYAIQSKRI